ncbi:hypothetical protein DMC01_13370 [Campylobacter troglodytis]|nr:hypothetical protein DMC01_13370 [Campylobacter troglodytis]
MPHNKKDKQSFQNLWHRTVPKCKSKPTIVLAGKEAKNLAPTFDWSVATDTREDIWRFQRLCAGFCLILMCH